MVSMLVPPISLPDHDCAVSGIGVERSTLVSKERVAVGGKWMVLRASNVTSRRTQYTCYACMDATPTSGACLVCRQVASSQPCSSLCDVFSQACPN